MLRKVVQFCKWKGKGCRLRKNIQLSSWKTILDFQKKSFISVLYKPRLQGAAQGEIMM